MTVEEELASTRWHLRYTRITWAVVMVQLIAMMWLNDSLRKANARLLATVRDQHQSQDLSIGAMQRQNEALTNSSQTMRDAQVTMQRQDQALTKATDALQRQGRALEACRQALGGK